MHYSYSLSLCIPDCHWGEARNTDGQLTFSCREFLLLEGGKLKGKTVHKTVGVTLQKALEGRLLQNYQNISRIKGMYNIVIMQCGSRL